MPSLEAIRDTLKLFRYPLVSSLIAVLLVVGELIGARHNSKPVTIVFAVGAGVAIIVSAIFLQRVQLFRRRRSLLVHQIFDSVRQRIAANDNQPLLVGNREVSLALMPTDDPSCYRIHRRSVATMRAAFQVGDDWWVQEGEAFEVSQSVKPKVTSLGQLIVGEICTLERNDDSLSAQAAAGSSREAAAADLSSGQLQELRDQIRDHSLIPATWRKDEDGDWSFKSMIDLS